LYMRHGFRADIEGMRAVAIGAVLLAHAGVPFAKGGFVGVDVFFVISGFLITGLLLRELESTGRISLKRFYARRVRRLLPLAILVLLVTAVLSQVMFSPVTRDLVARDLLAATVYVANWRFMAESVDYFASDVGASPVLHYWTLGIEEQFYLVWPALLIIGVWGWRRFGGDLRKAAWYLTLVVGGASLVYGIGFTREAADAAYFSTFGRAWELALGALIAIARAPRLTRGAAAVLGWGGLAAIAAAVLVFDSSTAFPGTAALLPTLGAAALILAGTGRDPIGAGALLGRRAFCHVGRLSYAWYLWHWPLLIFAAELWGPLSVAQGLAVVAFAYFPTLISHRLVEEPIHRSRVLARNPRSGATIWVFGSVASVTAALFLLFAHSSVPEAPMTEVRGAAALSADTHPQRSAKRLRPKPEDATDDRGPIPEDGCFVGEGQTRSPTCEYGDRTSDTTVVLFGDSHAMHHFPPLQRLARKRGWRLVALTKAGCPPNRAVNGADDPFGEDCHEWREAALERIDAEGARLVVASGATAYAVNVGDRKLEGDERELALENGYVSVIERLRDGGAKVAVVKDPPRPPHDVPSCVSESLDRLERCAFGLPPEFDEQFDSRAAARTEGAELVDVTPKICFEGECAAVIGDALVYRNKGHLTATFAATLAPELERQLPPVP